MFYKSFSNNPSEGKLRMCQLSTQQFRNLNLKKIVCKLISCIDFAMEKKKIIYLHNSDLYMKYFYST